MSARLAALLAPLAGLCLLASPTRAFAQEEPAPAPALPAPGACTVVVVLPSGPVCAPPGPAPQAPPPGYYPAPQAPPPGYYPAPRPLPPGAYYPGPTWAGEPPLLVERPRSVFSAKVWAGPSYQRLYDISIYGADFGVSLGAQRGISGWYAEMQGFAGRTDHGLSTFQYWLGPTWEARLDRIHLGLGLHVGWMGIERATTRDMITGLGFGFFGFASVDLYQSEEGHALYAAARMTGNWVDGGNTTAPQYGPSVMLGYRY